MYNVNNVSKDYVNHKYSVIRNCDGEYWYYGSYDSLERSQEVCNSLCNGLIVESESINAMW
jgi:hypothetical protein